MQLRKTALYLFAALSLSPSLCFAADQKDERGGTCEDAKAQFEYFCNRQGHQNDIMMNAPIACNNAKRNMAAACEGKVDQDKKYEFKDNK